MKLGRQCRCLIFLIVFISALPPYASSDGHQEYFAPGKKCLQSNLVNLEELEKRRILGIRHNVDKTSYTSLLQSLAWSPLHNSSLPPLGSIDCFKIGGRLAGWEGALWEIEGEDENEKSIASGAHPSRENTPVTSSIAAHSFLNVSDGDDLGVTTRVNLQPLNYIREESENRQWLKKNSDAKKKNSASRTCVIRNVCLQVFNCHCHASVSSCKFCSNFQDFCSVFCSTNPCRVAHPRGVWSCVLIKKASKVMTNLTPFYLWKIQILWN